MIDSGKKGGRNERGVAKLFEEWTGYEFARTPQSGGLHWKKAHTSGDIVCIDERHSSRFPFSIECKFHKELDLLHLIQGLKGKKSNKIVEFWEQSVRDAKPFNKEPLVFMRRNMQAANTHFVIMNQSLLIDLPDDFNVDHGIITYSTPEINITIFNSMDFFSWDYKTLKKIARHVTRNKA